jgi:hypothetical protein
MQKLGLTSRAEIVRYALQSGALEVGGPSDTAYERPSNAA